jgi:hypothetical protein
MSAKKYGNDHYWAFIEDGWNGKAIAIWKGPEGKEEIIANAVDKYEAKVIIDALLNYVFVEDKTKFGKKELAFLEFAAANMVEPYSTMASNAILWNDRDAYNNLKEQFSVIYS